MEPIIRELEVTFSRDKGLVGMETECVDIVIKFDAYGSFILIANGGM